MASAKVAVGTVVADRYQVERLLGEGGMGTVWAARHTTTRKPVALKFLKTSDGDSPRVRQRFVREARAACAIRHPSVIEVHDVLELADGSPFMVMELLEGETFAALLAREEALRVPTLARLMLPVCSAVGKAHELGIVHRDLKPENIFLERDGDADAAPRVKVLDFGIAKLTAIEGDAAKSTDHDTGTGTILGTPFYMSPEQMFGEKDVDHRSDIWSLGIIFYQALAGVLPTEADNIGQVLKIVMTDAIIPLAQRAPSLPEPLCDLVTRMLSRAREARPLDLREVCDVLRAYSNEPVPSFGAPTRRELTLPPMSETIGQATTQQEGENRPPKSVGFGQAATLPEGDLASVTPRPGVDAAPSRVPRSRSARPAAVVVLVLAGVAVGGSVMIRGRSSTPAHATVVASVPTAVPAPPPTVSAGAFPAPPPGVVAPSTSPSAPPSAPSPTVGAVASASSVRRTSRMNEGAPPAAATATSPRSSPPPSVSARVPAPTPVDPGSYL